MVKDTVIPVRYRIVFGGRIELRIARGNERNLNVSRQKKPEDNRRQ